MCKPPRRKKAPVTPVPLDGPEIELGADDSSADLRQRQARGRNQLRTGLNIGDAGTGLSIGDSGVGGRNGRSGRAGRTQ